jgi:hypothetical protein
MQGLWNIERTISNLRNAGWEGAGGGLESLLIEITKAWLQISLLAQQPPCSFSPEDFDDNLQANQFLSSLQSMLLGCTQVLSCHWQSSVYVFQRKVA